MTTEGDWKISIYVPESLPAPPILEPDQASDHSLKSTIGAALRRVVTVPVEGLQDQWARTLDTLMALSSAISKRSGEWKIEEIEVGLTLSAKGELLFIAEAGAEASIKFTLTPK